MSFDVVQLVLHCVAADVENEESDDLVTECDENDSPQVLCLFICFC